MQDLDLAQALLVARQAAKSAREVLLSHFKQLKKVQEKAQAGLVSEADLESERVIGEILRAGFPQIPVVGEEGAFLAQDSSVPATAWIVDPLDGTTNYVHGFAIFNISIGLRVNGELVVGVVDVPILDETYHAVRGGGVFKNQEPLAVSRRQKISESLLATGFFPDNIPALKEQLKIFSELVFEARGIRRPGAAAYDLALVAEGVFDAFWEPNLKPWDAAAGVVLVREAGGVVWNYSGQPYDVGDLTLLAANPHLAEELVQRISRLRVLSKSAR